MNRLSIIAKSIGIALGMVGIASADMGFSHHSLLNNWTGFYAGANAGIAFNNAQLRSHQIGFTNPNTTCNACSNSSTLFPGIQAGYLHQFPSYFVLGVEANSTLNVDQKNTLNCISTFNPNVYDRFSITNQSQNSIKGRLGRAMNWHQYMLLPYLTAGASFANLALTYRNEGGNYYTKNTTSSGWLIGTGIEWAVRQNWSLRAEYFYINYGRAINLNIPNIYGLIDPNGMARVNLYSNSIAVSIIYWI